VAYSYTGCRSGMWRSQVAHLLWEQGVGSSNLPIPTSSACLTCGFVGLAYDDRPAGRRSDGEKLRT
jgi:hypothetical protein